MIRVEEKKAATNRTDKHTHTKTQTHRHTRTVLSQHPSLNISLEMLNVITSFAECQPA